MCLPAHMYVRHMCVSAQGGGGKRASHFLEPELWMVCEQPCWFWELSPDFLPE
jgi:hypothetical protein